MELISIIIPVYNVEDYLEECLNSVTQQSYKNIEIILINDGSTDNSEKICKDFLQKDQRIRYFFQKNKGLSAARNKGIEMALGQYISFIDSDDKVENNFIEALYTALKKHNTAIASASIQTIPEGKLIEPSDFLDEKGICYISPSNIKEHVGSSWKHLYTKNLLKSIPPFIEGLRYEDIYFTWVVLIKAQKISYTRNTHYLYRIQREGSIVSTKGEHHLDYLKSYKELQIYLKENNLWDDYKHPYFYNCFTKAFAPLFKTKNKLAFIQYLKELMKADDSATYNLNFEDKDINRYYNFVKKDYKSQIILFYIQVDRLKVKISRYTKKEKIKEKFFKLTGLSKNKNS